MFKPFSHEMKLLWLVAIFTEKKEKSRTDVADT